MTLAILIVANATYDAMDIKCGTSLLLHSGISNIVNKISSNYTTTVLVQLIQGPISLLAIINMS